MEIQLKRFQREIILGNWARDDSFDVLAKNETALGPGPKNLPEAKLKSFRVMLLAKESFKTI